MAAAVPDGHLLLQAGLQLEWLTNGTVMAGMHEVVVSPATVRAIAEAKSRQRPSPPGAQEAREEEGGGHAHLWRVSSTLFSHIASDESLRPVLPLDAEAAGHSPEAPPYPDVRAGDLVLRELRSIALAQRAVE